MSLLCCNIPVNFVDIQHCHQPGMTDSIIHLLFTHNLQDDCLAINRGSNITFAANYCRGGHGASIVGYYIFFNRTTRMSMI